MKFLRVCLFALCAGLVFSSCEKDLSSESGTAAGTLKDDGSGDCLPVAVNGTYTVGTALGAANSLDIQVIFTSTGVYNIKSDTINGYSFSGIGTANVTGPVTVHLVASGTPAVLGTGVDIFHITYGTSSCNVNVVLGGSAPTSVFTLGGAGGTCTGATLTGIYTQGMSATGNTATVNVNVLTAGTYNITTGAVNGVTFNGSGTFATTGAHTITLIASGVAGTSATGTYPLTSGTSTCSFTVPFAPAGSAANYSIVCTGAVVSGTYQAGTAMTASNQMTVTVNATTAGSFNINSTANNVTFSGSGTLVTGSQPITLTATGTPATAGVVPYTIAGTSSSCSVNVTYTSGSSGTYFITAKINGVFTTFNVVAGAYLNNTTNPPYSYIIIDGNHNTGATQEELYFTAGTTTGYPVSGSTFTVNDNTTHDVIGDYTLPDGSDDARAESNFPTIFTNPFTITFTTVTATVATGTFSGRLLLNGGGGPGFIDVTEGAFNVPF